MFLVVRFFVQAHEWAYKMPAILIELISNKYQPISQEGSLHGSTHAQKEALSVRFTEVDVQARERCYWKIRKKTQKGTEKLIIHDSRTGVSQGHFKEIWDPVRSLNFHGSARHCNRCGPTAGTHSRRSSDHLHTNFQVSKSCMT